MSQASELSLSIEKSRKRHLSPGLLRGDRVADLLRVQELAASPDLKRQKSDNISAARREENPTSSMAMTMAEFELFMNKNVTPRLDKLDNLESSMGEFKGSLSKMSRTIKQNTQKVDSHTDLIKKNAEEIASIGSELAKSEVSSPTPAALT
ncbi:hypothetical protein, partial [uncultured Tateyamaria sp.]|uniref:hypothetical protein n=1 Tax=uncultured Tateyamaria sp. TaxID=455651 RepID=UPI00263305E3